VFPVAFTTRVSRCRNACCFSFFRRPLLLLLLLELENAGGDVFSSDDEVITLGDTAPWGGEPNGAGVMIGVGR